MIFWVVSLLIGNEFIPTSVLLLNIQRPYKPATNEHSWNPDATNELIEGESVYKTNDREESYDDYSCGDVNKSGGINEYMKTGEKASFGYEVSGSDIDDRDTNIEGG